jgi:hypothetical protein
MNSLEEPLSLAVATTLVAMDDARDAGRGAGRETLRFNLIGPDYSNSKGESRCAQRGECGDYLSHKGPKKALKERERGIAFRLEPVV